MKTSFTHLQYAFCALALGLIPLSCPAAPKEMTAFDLAKEGNRSLGEDSKDKVIQIRSEKSIDSLVPGVWYVVYYDPDAGAKTVEVKFGAGQKLEVSRPGRPFGSTRTERDVLPAASLKIDSDKALQIASKEPLLEKLTLKASRLALERRSDEDPTPVWKVRLWAAKLKNPSTNTEVGEVVISAEDGRVLKSDLKPDRAG